MNARLAAALLVVAVPLAGCAGPGSRSTAPRAETAAAGSRLQSLLAGERYREVIDQVEQQLAATTEPADRALLETLRARALTGDDRARSAVLSFQRALRECPPAQADLLRQIHQGWGDAEVTLGHGPQATEHYEAALAAGRVSPRDHDDLCYSGYVALREAHDAAADGWRSRISRFSESRLAAVERRLLPHKPEPPPPAVAARGLIPDDPREILPGIRRRADWGAAPIRGDYHPMTPITRITVHHTALDFTDAAPAVVAAELRQLQSNHQEKWADLGYHFVIDPGGTIWEGRELQYQGAHEGVGLNQGSIGICLMGNFDEQDVPRAQLAALTDLLGACCARFGLQRADIKTHREVRPEPTECPGTHLQQWVDAYRRSSDTLSLARQ